MSLAERISGSENTNNMEIQDGKVLLIDDKVNSRLMIYTGKDDSGKSVFVGQFDDNTIIECRGNLTGYDKEKGYELGISYRASYISKNDISHFEAIKKRLEDAEIWEEKK